MMDGGVVYLALVGAFLWGFAVGVLTVYWRLKDPL